MKNKKEKQQDLDQLRAQLEANKNIFLAGYEKMKVDQDFELRKTVRGAGGTYKVGMCAIAYTSGDPVALAKALTVYAKANPAFVFKAGMVEGRVVDVSGINQLATLPSKEEIFSKLLYVINAPAQQLVTAMNGVGRNLAVVVDQGVKENKFQG